MVSKESDFSEWFTQLMQKAELADIRYNIKGFPVYLPWAVKSIKKITNMWETELENTGHEPLLMPVLIPESNFTREAEHIDGFTPEVFWVTGAGDKTFDEKLALRPTSETALYDMYGKWINSYNDLPFKRYQTCSVYRYETKMTRPFLRTRELYWSEAHNVFATREDSLNQVKQDMEITHKLLYKKLSLPHIFFERPQWDKFAGAESTFAADVLLPSGKVLQLPSTHLIGKKFSEAFNVKFKDKDESEKLGWITCYGPCHSRNYGALITFHGDDTGLKLPWDIAPLQIIIIPIYFKNKFDIVDSRVELIKNQLEKLNYSVKIDDRKEFSPGYKYNHWELKGVPIRIEVGPRDVENNQIIIFRRDISEKNTVSMNDLIPHINSIKETFTQNMISQADEVFDKTVIDVQNKNDIKKNIDDGKMIRTSFCSIDMDGAECAGVIEKETKAEVRGVWFNKNEEVFCNCIVCGKPAKHVVYIAKSH